MSLSKISDSLTKRESPFCPKVQRMDKNTSSIVKIMMVSLVLFMFIAPITMDFEPTTAVITQNDNHASPAQTELFYHYVLPDTNIRIAVGEVSGYRGFVYILEEESRLYFVDLINDVTMDIALPLGAKANGAYLKGYDVDLDGNSEFFCRNFVNSTYYILMIDIDDATVSQFPMPFVFPAPMGFGIFNGDAFPDLLVQNVNNRDNFLTLDIVNNVTIGTFNGDYAYVNPVIGRFASATQDSIAFVNQMGTTNQRNLTVVEADGTQVQNILLTYPVQDMVKFDHLGGLEEIATIEDDGDLVVYSGLTLAVEYTQNVDTLPSSSRYIETGDFNADPQDDLVVVSRSQERAYFRDGNLGFSIRDIDGVYSTSSRELAVGTMDQDDLDELAIGTIYGGLGVIRGVDGELARIEYLADVQNYGHQIIGYDCVGNGRDDVVVRIVDSVFIIRSDTTQPIVTPRPIDPVHPTILDDYVTIRVDVDESSTIEYIDIWMKLPGSVLWLQPQDEMYASHTEGLYYAFIGNLQPGEYEYYIVAQDSYLNVGYMGNSTHPHVFTVAGDFVWQIDKTDMDYVHRRYHQSDLGNLSNGRPAIYTIERASGELDLTLMKYSQGGGLYDSLTIANPSGIPFDNFALFTAMLDGDSIQDIIVLDLYYDKDYVLRYHVYHGSSFSLMGNGTIPFPYKSFNYLGVFDDDGDGNEELFLVSDTEPFNIIKMDSDLSWTGVELLESTNWRYAVRGFSVISGSPQGYISIVRGNIQIDILTTDLVYSHSLDIDMDGYANMDYAGIHTIYNATLGSDQFVAGYTYWNGTDPTSRFFVFDSSTTNVNNTPVYQLPHQYVTYFYPGDASGDMSDELFIKLPGQLLLGELDSSLSIAWSTPVTVAAPLSAMIVDFDGDTQDEFILFTDQDELLTQVSFTGEVEWTVEIGEIYNPLLLGNIDSIPGDEIAAYPIATVTSYTLGAIRNLDTHYVLNVTVEQGLTEIVQGGLFDANVTVLNVYDEIVRDASVYLSAHYNTPEGPAVNTFALYFGWSTNKYWGETDASWSMGFVNLSVLIQHNYYHQYQELFIDELTIRSHLHVFVEAPPFINQGDNMSIVVRVTDNLDRLVEDATVAVTLGGLGQAATPSELHYVVDYPELMLEAGLHVATASAYHPFALDMGFGVRGINVKLLASSLTVSTDFPSVIQQGELISTSFNIADQYGAPVTGAVLALVSGPYGFGLIESSEPGVYIFEHNVNLELGNHAFELRTQSPNVVGDVITEVSFSVVGVLDFFVSFSPEEPVQGQPLIISVIAVDSFGNPVPGLELTVSMMNMPPIIAMETDQVGEYIAIVEHIPLTEGYGAINVTIEAIGEHAILSTKVAEVYIDPATPDFALISPRTIGLGVGASFLLSLIGMILYFRMASSIRVDDKSKDVLKKSVRNMDRLYLVIVLASGVGLVSSYSMYMSGGYGLSLVLTVALLGCSILLYGLWLYRDATSAVLVRGSLNRKRMVLGLWHLIYVPVVIFLILTYGVEIDWFRAYIIDQSFTIGAITVPTIMTTIFTAYVSSILVVVINLYREVSKSLKKLKKMEEAGTPAGIIEDEKSLMVGRFSSSIRIKFLMFLVIVGATTVMSMDFLASWELGIIILLPVAFLVVIPFISSKIIQVFSKLSRGRIPTAPLDA